MVKRIVMSDRSKDLINQLSQVIDDKVLSAWSEQKNAEIGDAEIVAWLQQKKEDDKTCRFLLESLHTALLGDLHDSFLSPLECHNKKKGNTTHWFNRAQFIFLAAAGTLLAICEGFDGIASILGSFAAVPTILVFVGGITFSLLSVGVFCGFDLVEISKQVGVSLGKSNQLLDVLVEQVEQIDRLRKKIDDRYADDTLDANERLALQQLIAMLVVRYNALDDVRETYLTALNNPILRAAKFATAAMTALFFFGGGFFAGQTLALAVAGLFIASVSVTFWPVVAVSSVVGLAALSLYWFVQRPGLENLVGHWMGLDKDNIEAFAGEEAVTYQKQALHKLKNNVALFEHLHDEIRRLTVPGIAPGLATMHQTTPADGVVATMEHRHSFFNRPRLCSLGDLCDHAHEAMLELKVA